MYKYFFIAIILSNLNLKSSAQSNPCNSPKFREFDFWIGNWEVYTKTGKLAGSSKISLILDSCVILEEWTSAGTMNNVIYKGKSFNTFNLSTNQWQQTWVDNTGNTTEFLRGQASAGAEIIFYADNVTSADGKKFMRRLTFTKLNENKVRQFGEKSEDAGKTWISEYDLEYRKK